MNEGQSIHTYIYVRYVCISLCTLRQTLFKCVFDEFVKESREIEENIKLKYNKMLTNLQGKNIQEIESTNFEKN